MIGHIIEWKHMYMFCHLFATLLYILPTPIYLGPKGFVVVVKIIKQILEAEADRFWRYIKGGTYGMFAFYPLII
ncbi:hypothetical protein ACJX0J_037526, partial [Zea mays]